MRDENKFKRPISVRAILTARCPSCHLGRIMKNLFSIYPRCQHCGYNFYPESGFYLGAMAISYLITAILTIPPMIVLKVLKVDIAILLAFPLIEFLCLGTFLMFYSRVLWLHLEYRMTNQLDHQNSNSKDHSGQ